MDFWQDVQAAADFFRRTAAGLPLALVGYSFGCTLLPRVGPHDGLDAFVLVAPTVAKHDYDAFRSLRRPLLVVASDDDFATDARRLDDWFATLTMRRRLERRRCDNHFFRGYEDWLTETVFRFLEDCGSEDR
jgi:alpha/beta superfamily hydrolase